MFILGLDTSSSAVAVDVVELVAGQLTLRARRAPVSARGHGELLAPLIAQCLAEAGIPARQLAAVVAGTGPGPFTGLRVGLVTAAAFAHALDIPSYGACSLDGIAGITTQTSGADTIVVTDARRREVYWARYDAAGNRLDGPYVAAPADVPLDGVASIAGAAVDLYDWPAHLIRLPNRYPQPAALIALAGHRISSAAPSEPLMPRYLRRPDAVAPGAPKRATQ